MGGVKGQLLCTILLFLKKNEGLVDFLYSIHPEGSKKKKGKKKSGFSLAFTRKGRRRCSSVQDKGSGSGK